LHFKTWHAGCFSHSVRINFLLIVVNIKEIKMRQSLLLIAVLGTLATSSVALAEEAVVAAATEDKSNWDITTNMGFVSDYYARGVSQTWHKPTVQGGIDVTHSSGFYAGVFGSGVTPNTYPDANTEIDIYAGYNGEVSSVKGLGYTVGLIGYIYPGGSWKKYINADSGEQYTPKGGRWDTYEANFGVSYDWISAKASVTLTDWYGADKSTGFDGSSKGTTYLELNAGYPLPWWDLTLVGHVGRLMVAAKLDDSYGGGGWTGTAGKTSPNLTDYKVGLSKAFKVASSDGWTAGLYYVGATNGGNNGYWGPNGFGGPSFNQSSEKKDLTDDRVVFSLTRSF
jgi:uncharacterized protein (TIGR02001 family)